MGFMSAILKLGAILVLALAIIIGLFVSGSLNSFISNNNFSFICGSQENQMLNPMVGMFPFCVDQERAWKYEDLPNLEGKVALVTGANIGLGFYTAKHLAIKGASVVMGCRNMGKCDAAAAKILNDYPEVKVYPMKVDLSSLQSTQDFASSVLKSFEQLDMLVLNAGIALPKKEKSFSADGIELHFAITHLGHFKLYKDLLPIMENNNGNVSIVLVSSAAHYHAASGTTFTLDYINSSENNAEYPLSKLSNILFSNEIAARSPSNIHSNSLHPGFVDTNIFATLHSKLQSIPIIGAMLDSLFQQFQDNVMWSSEEGALTQTYLAGSTEVFTKGLNGKYFHPIGIEVNPFKQMVTKENQIELWKLSEQLLQEKGF
jgi:NAD(P)-dependent dehydrogenase (short-subunit alcohol dehydrogenase family)